MTAHSGIFIEIIDLYDWEPLKKSYKFQHTIKGLDPKVVDQMQEGFARYILDLFKSLVKNAVFYQRFPIPLTPLSPKYVAYKRRKGLHQGFWQATRFLMNNLSYWKKDRNTFAIGFRQNSIHPESKLTCFELVKVLEQGTKDGRIPGRPLFFPVSSGISKNIYSLFRKFIQAKFPQYVNDLLP